MSYEFPDLQKIYDNWIEESKHLDYFANVNQIKPKAKKKSMYQKRQQKNKRVEVRLEEKEYKELHRITLEKGDTISSVVRRGIKQYIES
jgi:hypothetical protein